MTTKVSRDESVVWSDFASAAFGGYIGLNVAGKEAAVHAAAAADALLAEYLKRRKAHSDYISGKS